MPAPNGILELTREMSLPPSFDPTDPVAVFDVTNDRDLVAEICSTIRLARQNGVDVCALFDHDLDLARDLQNFSDDYDDVHIDTLTEAVRQAREYRT